MSLADAAAGVSGGERHSRQTEHVVSKRPKSRLYQQAFCYNQLNYDMRSFLIIVLVTVAGADPFR
jgi:hypothetical protein